MSAIPDLPKLTKNQGVVLEALQQAAGPQSAYDLLGKLGEHGLKAPPQVYRALEKLVALGLAHRLESLNAFVACEHDHHHHGAQDKDAVVFTICNVCGQVDEISDSSIAKQLDQLARKSGFNPERTTLELHGNCQKCEIG